MTAMLACPDHGLYNPNMGGCPVCIGEPQERYEQMIRRAVAMDRQEGGSHYSKHKIQPVEYIHKNGIDFLAGNIIKYATRHKDKNGAEDVRKIIHYAELILQLEYGEGR